MQLWNVVAGGGLFQHIEGHRYPRVAEVHAVDVLPGTLLSRILGARRVTVNSRHHQAVERLGSGLVKSALAADGTIEGIESPVHRFAMAVQWHPEDLVDTHADALALFEAFARAVAGETQS
jgi:putative glutamine amidotransferase